MNKIVTNNQAQLQRVSRLNDIALNKDVAMIVVPKTDNRGMTNTIVELADFMNENRLVARLLEDGADPRESNFPLLIKELPDKAGILTNRTGWVKVQDEWKYLLFASIVPMQDGRLLVLRRSDHEPGIGIGQASGSLDDWLKHVATPAAKSKAVLFALCAAFAGPYLKFSSLREAMILNFSAKTSTGKSTLVKVAASVFGNPAKFPGWNLTETRLYEAASAYNDNVVILDDVEAKTGKLSKRMADAHEVLHAFTSGQPRGVSRVVSSAMVKERFNSIALSSSPTPILWSLDDQKVLEDSDRVRLLEITIPESRFGIWDPSIALNKDSEPFTRQETDDLAQDALRYYGTVGKEWIEYLDGAVEEIASDITKGTEAFLARHPSNEARKNRIGAKIGLIEVAGKDAVKGGFLPCAEADVENACDWAFKEILKTAFGHELSLGDILDHMQKVLDEKIFKYYPQSKVRMAQSLKACDGFINEDNERLIMKERGFERLFDDLLPSSTAARANMLRHVRSTLVREGIYITDAGGHHVISVNIAGSGQQRWVIDLSRYDEVVAKLQTEQPKPKASCPSKKRTCNKSRRRPKK